MKKVFLVSVLFLLIAGFGAQAQERAMQIYNGNLIVARYNVSEVDSVTFVEIASQEEEGVVINGIRWATRNVDYPGTFAATPESPGMLYQWNKKVGWSNTDPMINHYGGTIWDSSTLSGTTWEEAQDPCPAGWRVPTLDEIKSLLSTGSSLTTYNGVLGRLFGISQDVYLFMPAAGQRNQNDGSLGGVGYGYYWGSTKYINSAVHLEFYSGSAGWSNAGFTRYGRSVRCVADE
jgi:uncharacterized protein (TIGR02145 family)